jgi:hypothetical protein
MSINRSKLWLVLGVQLMIAAVAQGQETPEAEWVPGVRDFQPFAPAGDVVSAYGRGRKPTRGWFFTLEDLAWTTGEPSHTAIGFQGPSKLVSTGVPGGYIEQPNTMNTGFIQPRMQQGGRFQLGYVGDDGVGWLVGYFQVHSGSYFGEATDAGVNFNASDVGGIMGTNPLEGFIEERLSVPANQPPPFGTGGAGGGGGGAGGGTGGGTAVVDTDINGNHVFGGSGQDIGTPTGNTTGPLFQAPPDGFPDLTHGTDFGDLVNLPIFFSHVETKYTSRIWSIEVMRTWQLTKSRRNRGNQWDLLGGVRYIKYRDFFYFLGEGYSTALSPGGTGGGAGGGGGSASGVQVIEGLLSNTRFSQYSDNNLVGPQFGLRWSGRRGRLGLDLSGRFGAMANFQNNRQSGAIAQRPDPGTLQPSVVVFNPQASSTFLNSVSGGSGTTGGSASSVAFNVPQFRTPSLVPQGVNHTHNVVTWAPVGEFRANLNYQIFRQVSATVGWTGIVLGGIGQAPNQISYSLPNLGILSSGDRKVVFVQGINFGFNVNY